MKKSIFLLFLTSVSLAAMAVAESLPPSSAASNLSLASAVDEGLAHSPEIHKLEAQKEAAAWKRLEALSPNLPHLSAAANQILDQKYLYLSQYSQGMVIEFPSAGPTTTINLDVSWMIFDGLSAYNAYQAADLNYQASQAALTRARFQLEQNIRLHFYQTLAAQALLEVAGHNITTLKDHLAIAKVGVRSGTATSFNVLRIEALLEEAQAEKIQAENNEIMAKRSLYLTMGAPEDSRTLKGALPKPQEQDLNRKLVPDFSNRDDLRAQVLRQKAAEKASLAATGFWWPKLILYGEEQFYKYKAFDPAIVETQNFKTDYMLGVRLTWSFFDGGATWARQKEAGYQAQSAAASSRQMALAAPVEFDSWKRKWTYNTILFQARLRAEEKSQESVRLATLGLQAGTNTNTDVLDAELDLFRARAGIVQAQLNAAEALINLELALGYKLQ